MICVLNCIVSPPSAAPENGEIGLPVDLEYTVYY